MSVKSPDQASPSQEAGIDESFLMMALSRMSLSPRGRLTGIIQKGNISDISDELTTSAEQFSAIELTVCIYALLQQEHPQQSAPALAHGLLMLTNRLSSINSCCYQTWQSLFDLFSKKPTFCQLSDFLEEDNSYDNDEADATFVYKTCQHLTSLPLARLDLPNAILTDSVEPWINKRLLNVDDCLSSLLLTHAVCRLSAEEIFDLETLSQTDSCQKFVLEAISKCRQEERALKLLMALQDTVGGDDWSFIKQLPENALSALLCTVKSHKLHIKEKTLSLKLCQNPHLDTIYKLCLLQETIQALPSCPFSFLYKLMPQLVVLSCSTKTNISQKIKEIIDLCITKEWDYDLLSIHDYQSDLDEVYQNPMNKFINGDFYTLSEFSLYDAALLKKCIKSVIKSLESFAKVNAEKIRELGERRGGYRCHRGLEMKTACIGLLFFLYKNVHCVPTQKEMFEYLKTDLQNVQVTNDTTEQKILDVSNRTMAKLSYSHNGTLYKIKLSK